MVVFLKSVQGTDITEEDFIRQYKAVPCMVTGRRKHNTRSTHNARKEYRNLKTKFGFFEPQNKARE